MTYVQWSPLLPQVQRAGNYRQPVDLSARTTMDVGPRQARRRHEWPREMTTLVVILSDNQLAYFDGWWHHILHHGCAWLEMTLSGERGHYTTRVRCAGGYRAEFLSGRWRVTIEAEVEDPPREEVVEEDTREYVVNFKFETPDPGGNPGRLGVVLDWSDYPINDYWGASGDFARVGCPGTPDPNATLAATAYRSFTAQYTRSSPASFTVNIRNPGVDAVDPGIGRFKVWIEGEAEPGSWNSYSIPKNTTPPCETNDVTATVTVNADGASVS